MRALVLDYRKHEIAEKEVPEPVFDGRDEVLYRIREVGICGTDRELASFRFGYGPAGDDYLIPGHEATGVVMKAGPEASGFRPGDIVVPAVRRACSPACESCARRRRDLCLTGNYTERGIFGAHGYFTEQAVDCAEDLVRIPPAIANFAVLVEPLSVVEKAVETTLRLHDGTPRTALVIGAGTVGLLAAMVLRLRGLHVDIVSAEPPHSARARLAEDAGARYLARPDRKVDVVIEAAGADEAAAVGARSLGPLGVLMILGARTMPPGFDLLEFIVGNRKLAGSVNAGPEAFRLAVEDLARMPHPVLAAMIERTGFADYRRTLTGSPSGAPKIVHVLP